MARKSDKIVDFKTRIIYRQNRNDPHGQGGKKSPEILQNWSKFFIMPALVRIRYKGLEHVQTW